MTKLIEQARRDVYCIFVHGLPDEALGVLRRSCGPDEFGKLVDKAARAVVDLVLEEAAMIAAREGVYPELNVAGGGPDWFKHGRRIAAAIRSLSSKGGE